MPSMVVNNNETANLNSTSTQPYTTTTIQDSNVITARGGSASAGTTITVSPQIAAGDDIVLDYSMSLSSFVGEAASSGVEPPSQQTSLNSVATIPDGYTIALGGIEISSEGDSDTKTPVLADIPLLGGLFKSQSDSTSRSRFYIFIRATVMRSPSFEHLKYISEDLAQQLNVDDGWPEVEPRIMR
jgi:general secretion pathway protein D